MDLELDDEQAAVLIKELHAIVESDPYPTLATYPHPESGAREAATRTGAGAPTSA
jgi:hypothetical protein